MECQLPEIDGNIGTIHRRVTCNAVSGNSVRGYEDCLLATEGAHNLGSPSGGPIGQRSEPRCTATDKLSQNQWGSRRPSVTLAVERHD